MAKKKTEIFFGVGGGALLKHRIFGSVNGTLVSLNNFGLSISYKVTCYEAEGKPADYSAGNIIEFKKPPDDETHIISLVFVKQIALEEKQLKIGIEIGPSINYNSINTFVPSSGNSNYSVNTTAKNCIGLTIMPKFYYIFSRKVAITLGGFANFNRYQNFLGLEADFLFGRINN